jgi:hypothetical protein
MAVRATPRYGDVAMGATRRYGDVAMRATTRYGDVATASISEVCRQNNCYGYGHIYASMSVWRNSPDTEGEGQGFSVTRVS